MTVMRRFGFGRSAPPPIDITSSKGSAQDSDDHSDLPQTNRPSWARMPPDAWAGQFRAPAEEILPDPMRRGHDNYEDQLVELGPQVVEEGSVYTGQWRGDVRHGYGVLTRRDGQRYQGDFDDGCASGQGVYTDPIGNRYDGAWLHDRMHGFGKYCQADGSSYEGVWYQDQKSGKGTEIFADGSRYDGEYVMGSRCGYGKFEGADGKEYEGHFLSDKMDGDGRMKFRDGRTYQGQWQSGHIHGVGKTTWLNGCKYEGWYVNDLKHGTGTFTWADGRVYRGQWFRGKQHGKGTTIDEHGHSSSAEWKNGVRLRGARSRTPSENSSPPPDRRARFASNASPSPRSGQVTPRRDNIIPPSPRSAVDTPRSRPESPARPSPRLRSMPTSYFGDEAPVEGFVCGEVGTSASRRVYMV